MLIFTNATTLHFPGSLLIYIAIFFTIFHYHPKIFGLILYAHQDQHQHPECEITERL